MADDPAAAALEEIRQREQAATSGPWWSDEDKNCWRLHGVHGSYCIICAEPYPCLEVQQITSALLTCGQCQDGEIPYDGCNCGGGGPDGIPAHEPRCGWEQRPNGCWDRLHPVAKETTDG